MYFCKHLLFAMFAVILHSALLSGALSLSDTETDCPKVCPTLWGPVCGNNSKLFKQFANSCLLKVENCRSAERGLLTRFVQTDLAWCTSEFVDNLREKLINLDLNKPECMKPCPMMYEPVCVSNGKLRALVSHKCEMDMYNCALLSNHLDMDQFRVLRNDSC